MKPKAFATEADLCAAFLAWVAREHPEIRAYAEWAGWDILLVYPEGWQIGVQAKLRLNAEVLGQAAPDAYYYSTDHERPAPDYRAVLVPEQGANLSGIASRLGLVVFSPRRRWDGLIEFEPHLRQAEKPDRYWPRREWVDWNPINRHELPPCPTDSIAGSPCPVSLTQWKLGALAVLAELAVRGTITTKNIKSHCDPRRWIAGGWLEPAGDKGVWKRGAACPNFDEQHPTAYALALDKATAKGEPAA
jgi:hypothetical protein